MRWYRDGEPIESIAPNDRALQYGDGLFETVAIRDGQPRLWSYHVERLQTGCQRLDLAFPAEQELADAVLAAIDANPDAAAHAVVKLLLSAGSGPRGYRRPRATVASLIVGIAESKRLPRAQYDDGVAVRVCNTRLAIQPQLAGIKTLNRLEQVMARNEWHDESVFEGLMLDAAGRLICGTMSNVFVVEGNSLATPAITRCGVAGVMRRHLLALLDAAKIPCVIRDIDAGAIDSCDGLILTNSQFGVLPVSSGGRRTWPQSAAWRQISRIVSQDPAAEIPA